MNNHLKAALWTLGFFAFMATVLSFIWLLSRISDYAWYVVLVGFVYLCCYKNIAHPRSE